MAAAERYFVGIDLGAGFGAKLGLFDDELKLISKSLLPLSELTSNSLEHLSLRLYIRISGMLEAKNLRDDDLTSAGIASAGILDKDGNYIASAGLPYLENRNLKDDLEHKLNKPVAIANDADSGAYAEWAEANKGKNVKEILYWAIGGGWGGAWISNGKVLHPSTGWDGNEKNLHITNEPGYALQLPTELLSGIFSDHGWDYEAFEAKLKINNFGSVGKRHYNSIRAEWIISGPGILRLFKTKAEGNPRYSYMMDTSTDCSHIDELAAFADNNAIMTYNLFGNVLAAAAERVIVQAIADGADPNIPICLAGKVSRALPYFNSSFNEYFIKQRLNIGNGKGKLLMPRLNLSIIESRGENPNLLGAAILAKEIYYNCL